MTWIRSQDKMTLSNVNNMYVRVIGKGYAISSDKCDLGKYSSEQKALKVIDMIEDAILKCEAMRTGYAEYDFGEFVFDMPADKDVEV